jgi:hypothetical protein
MQKELNRDFYVNEIGVLDWLYDENIYQKIRFERQGMFVYKFNNKLHCDTGPAIEYFDNSGNQYYLNGNKVTWEEHTNHKRGYNLDKCLKIKTKKEKASNFQPHQIP